MYQHLARRSGSHRWRAAQRSPSLCWPGFHFKSSWRCAAERRGVNLHLVTAPAHVPRGAHWLLPHTGGGGQPLSFAAVLLITAPPAGQPSPLLNRATLRVSGIFRFEFRRPAVYWLVTIISVVAITGALALVAGIGFMF